VVILEGIRREELERQRKEEERKSVLRDEVLDLLFWLDDAVCDRNFVGMAVCAIDGGQKVASTYVAGLFKQDPDLTRRALAASINSTYRTK